MENKLFQDKWAALQSKIKQKWPKFSDQDLKQINGEKNKFMNELQKKYGIDRNHAEQELQMMSDSLVSSGATKSQGMNKQESQGMKQQQQSKGSNRQESHGNKHDSHGNKQDSHGNKQDSQGMNKQQQQNKASPGQKGHNTSYPGKK